ncbi:MAG: hypothetical protein ACPGGB_07470, partial [Flavobacteriales bacterium]
MADRMSIPYRHIAIEGGIGAGKSTLATALAERDDVLAAPGGGRQRKHATRTEQPLCALCHRRGSVPVGSV